MINSALAVLAGAAITAVYFFLYYMIIGLTRNMAPHVGQAVILFSYFGRLLAVGVLLVLAIRVGRMDPLLTGGSFLVIYTMALAYTIFRLAPPRRPETPDGKE